MSSAATLVFTPVDLAVIAVSGLLFLALLYVLVSTATKSSRDGKKQDSNNKSSQGSNKGNNSRNRASSTSEGLEFKKRKKGKQTQRKKKELAFAPSGKKAVAAAPVAVLNAYNPNTRHPLQIRELNGHKEEVSAAAFSPDGHFLVTASTDRQLLIFRTANLGPGGKFNLVRANVTLDSCVHLAFTDRNTLYAVTDKTHTVRRYTVPDEIGKKNQKLVLESEFTGIDVDVVGFSLLGSGAAVLSGYDTTLRVLTLSGGDVVADIDTQALRNNACCASPDGRFFAVAAYTPNVQVYETTISAAGGVSDARRVMELCGHSSEVVSVSFAADSSTVATGSRDGSWRTWSLDVRYGAGADPRKLTTVKTPDSSVDCVALSPDGAVVVTACGNTLRWWDASSGEMLDFVDAAHRGRILTLTWAPDGQWLVSTATDPTSKLWQRPQ